MSDPRPSGPTRARTSTPARSAPFGLRALAASSVVHVAGIAGLGVALTIVGRDLLTDEAPRVVVAMDLAEPAEELTLQVEPDWALDPPPREEPAEPLLRETELPDDPLLDDPDGVPSTTVEVAWWTELLDLPEFEPERPDEVEAEAPEPAPEDPSEPTLPPATVEVEPVLVSAPAPAYPALAQRRGWEGTVLCLLTVDAEGTVVGASVETSSGRDCLDDAALEAVKAWRFRPGLRDGAADEFEVRHRITFRLRK